MSDNQNTLSEFLLTSLKDKPQHSGLKEVITSIGEGTKSVNQQVQQGAIVDALGTTGDTNIQGEIVQKLDKLSSDTFVDVLSKSEKVAVIGCEEIERPVIAGTSENHSYIVLMDPLDGSSNIDVAVSIGSIFGIWKRNPLENVDESSLLRPGNEQVAAVYVVYGSSTVLVTAIDKSVQGFTLDSATNTFMHTHKDIVIPNECPYYSTNEGNFEDLEPNTKEVVLSLRNSYSLRYVGSLVADFHRNLLKGGVFLYPRDVKRPEGRLRLMYEANPLGYVVEQAGGMASTGRERILDIIPEQLHQRTPLILGNTDVVEKIIATINN